MNSGGSSAASGAASRKLGLLLAVLAVGACSSSSDGTAVIAATTSNPPSSIFAKSVTSLEIEVDYATNAAPYTGSVGRIGDVWQITDDNLTRLFQGSPKTLTVPRSLAEMQELTDLPAGPYTSDALLAIANLHRDKPSAGAAGTYYVVFVDGYFDDGTGAQMDVLGVSLGDTGVVGMFKPVIAATESSLAGISRYVEQATVVHELGHAVGLVNRGVAMTVAHQDTAHGNHCTNTKCTMYWANEGSSSAIAFARTAIQTGSTVMFGAECLADIDAAAAAAK